MGLPVARFKNDAKPGPKGAPRKAGRGSQPETRFMLLDVQTYAKQKTGVIFHLLLLFLENNNTSRSEIDSL